MRAAAIQTSPILYERAANTDRLLALAEEAFRGGAQLVVAPEMATSGYCFYDRADAARVVEPIPGPTTERFERLCRRYGGVLVLGLAEEDPASHAYYNAMAAIGAQGVLGKYRKIHGFVSEPRWAMDGDLGPVVVETPVGRVGLLDCMDVEYMEMTRMLQALGADVIAFSANWPTPPLPSPIWWVRARETGIPLVAANRIGEERGVRFSGGSAIFGADGALLAELQTGEGVVFAEIGATSGRNPLPTAESLLPLSVSPYLYDPHEIFRLYGRDVLPEGTVTEVHALPFRGPVQDLERAVGARRGLILLPEFALGAPGEPPLGDADIAEIARICAARGIAIAAGGWQETGDGPASVLWLVTPEGLLLRRVRPASSQLPSPDPSVVDWGGIRLGLLFGEELEPPEPAHLAALAGADVLLVADSGHERASVPHPLAEEHKARGGEDHFFLPKARAMTEDVFILYASSDLPCAAFAPTFDGAGQISRVGVSAELDTRRVANGAPNPVRYKYHLAKRRPEAYRTLWER